MWGWLRDYFQCSNKKTSGILSLSLSLSLFQLEIIQLQRWKKRQTIRVKTYNEEIGAWPLCQCDISTIWDFVNVTFCQCDISQFDVSSTNKELAVKLNPVIQLIPNQSNRRSMVQWYFPFSIPWLLHRSTPAAHLSILNMKAVALSWLNL